ncbi:MAG: hypothetical protein WBQ09_03610 [Terriglobales bacterium]|jgi:hypothetical protein
MKKVSAAVAVLLMVGGVYLQVRGNSGGLLTDLMPAGRLTNSSAEKTAQRLTGTESRVGSLPDSPVLVSQELWPRAPNKPHRVMLSWQPGESALANDDIVGYNVYRCSSFTTHCHKINRDPVPAPEYVDDQVQGGRAYYYATTAVNRAGRQSHHSNVIRVVVPFP